LRRPTTAAERVWMLYLTAIIVAWCGFTVAVALGYQSADGSSPWAVRGVIVTVGVLVAASVALLTRLGLRRAAARPMPQRGVNGWLVRLPGWRLALIYWLGWVAGVGGALLGVSSRMHHSPPAFVWPLLIVGGAFSATGSAAQLRVICQRRSKAALVADVARGSHGSGLGELPARTPIPESGRSSVRRRPLTTHARTRDHP
jgi:hypothetical protein